MPFTAPCAILVPATIAHGFRFHAAGHRRLGGELHRGRRRRARRAVGRGAGAAPGGGDRIRWCRWADSSEANGCPTCAPTCIEEQLLAREGYRLAMRALLALIAIEVVRLAAVARAPAAVTLHAAPMRGWRNCAALLDRAFPPGAAAQLLRREAQHDAGPAQRSRQARDRRHRRPSDPPARVDRSQAPARLHRPRPIHEIAYDLAFSDPSHFTRFFRKQTGTTPQAFREGRGG